MLVRYLFVSLLSFVAQAVALQPELIELKKCMFSENDNNNCWQAKISQNLYIILKTDDFDCGTAGCVAGEYINQNNKIVYNNKKFHLQCDKLNEEKYLCFIVPDVYRFLPISKKLLSENYENPYVSKLNNNTVLIMDMSQDCNKIRGCSVFNYKIVDGKYIKDYPFVDMICDKITSKEVVNCRTISKYIDSL